MTGKLDAEDCGANDNVGANEVRKLLLNVKGVDENEKVQRFVNYVH